MTDRQQASYFFLIVFFFACGAGLLIYKNYNDYFQQKTEIDLEAASIAVVKPKPKTPAVLADGRLEVDQPKEGDTLGNSFTVSGYAQDWFEGTIVIKVYDAGSTLLYSGNTITSGDNYGHPAPFNASITLTATSTTPTGHMEFNDYSAKDGSLTYQKKININYSAFIP
ncbi:MAG: Gmad2 immunoglobulin-like domain-containing protein [Candidatus Doudnabacteria bacterium]|nr:Gmad2 immunoglobulin-like domain-containing protein [Candidatus Doudnabacteria bacterium]